MGISRAQSGGRSPAGAGRVVCSTFPTRPAQRRARPARQRMIGANPPRSIDTAMVLSAGLGTRMAAINGKLPKPLIALKGKPLIDHVLDRLAQAGVGRAVVNVHHYADLIEDHLKARRSPRITMSDERARLLDTGGGVKKALPQLGPRPFLIHNADSVWIESVG